MNSVDLVKNSKVHMRCNYLCLLHMVNTSFISKETALDLGKHY